MKTFHEFNFNINEGYIEDFKNRFKKKVEVKTGEKLRKTYEPEMLWKFDPKVEKVLNLRSNAGRSVYVKDAEDKRFYKNSTNKIPSYGVKDHKGSFRSEFNPDYFGRRKFNLSQIGINSNSQGQAKWEYIESYVAVGTKVDSLYIAKFNSHLDDLKNKANLLNLKIGQQIHVGPYNRLENIIDIKEVCYLQIAPGNPETRWSSDYIWNDFKCDLTLFFETESGIWSSYQIEPLNEDQYNKKMKIDGIDILYQGLIDLRDNGKIEFSFEPGKCKTGDFYTCTVTTNFTGVEGNKFFIEFMKDYETMCDRLAEDGYEVNLLSMNQTQIKFTVKHP